MTRTDDVFNCEMELATQMNRADPDGYWTGYATGLMRARFGCVAVGDRYHDAWSPNDVPGDQARGYRDGYAKLTAPVKIEPTMVALVR